MISIAIILALVADRLLGEVSRAHPLVGFGYLAKQVEAWVRPSVTVPDSLLESQRSATVLRQRCLGAACWGVLVIVPTALLAGLVAIAGNTLTTLFGIAVLYFCIGGRSLAEHARAVAVPLMAGDLRCARVQLSRIVSRDTADLNAQAITRGTVESVLENGSDALLAPVFWFVVAGAPGVLCYRLSNTLDAMWGYRNTRFLHFGWAAARMDDVLNWLPARCCALSYALAGRCGAALRCWSMQAPMCDSPNGGPVMAAGAGALGIVVGGTAYYGSAPHWRPTLGEGSRAQPADIERALRLVRRATAIWLLVIIAWECYTWI